MELTDVGQLWWYIQGASALLCCATTLKETDGHLPVAEIFAVKTSGLGPVHQPIAFSSATPKQVCGFNLILYFAVANAVKRESRTTMSSLGYFFEGGIALWPLSSQWEGSCIELKYTHSRVLEPSGSQRCTFLVILVELSFEIGIKESKCYLTQIPIGQNHYWYVSHALYGIPYAISYNYLKGGLNVCFDCMMLELTPFLSHFYVQQSVRFFAFMLSAGIC